LFSWQMPSVSESARSREAPRQAAYSRDWGETGPREVLADGARRMMTEMEAAAAGPSALVLFRMRPRAIAKHVGILTEPGSFLHAYERLGVIEEPLTSSWRRRIAFAFLFPQR
jgi:NlpC/P60 family putative phage cell wall peptidase